MVLSALPCAPRVGADIGFPRRYADAVVEDALDRLRWNAGAVVLDDDRPAVDRDRYDRRDLGFLGGIERVVEQLFLDHQRPFVDIVAGLVDQFPAGAEFHQPRHLERHARQLFRRFSRGFLDRRAATICKIRRSGCAGI